MGDGSGGGQAPGGGEALGRDLRGGSGCQCQGRAGLLGVGGGGERVLAAIDRTRAAARACVWAAAGANAPDYETSAGSPLVIDVDATLVNASVAATHLNGEFRMTCSRDHMQQG